MEEQLLFKPYPKQDEFIQACNSEKYTVLVYGGAMGGGKSYVAITYLILLCKIYPLSKWVIIRDSIPTMKKTALETFRKVCPSNFLEVFNHQDMTATFKNGSRIIFMAEDFQNDKDFDRFKGLEVNGFLLEQVEELQEGLLDICLIRAGRWRIDPMPKPIILATVNPTQNWVKKRIYEAYINNELPDDWFYLPATILDNPILAGDEQYMKNLTRLDQMTYRRHIIGDWSAFDTKNRFAYAFDEKKHVKPCTYNPHLEVILSFDFNCNPITCTAYHDYGDRIECFKEWGISDSDIYTLCYQIKADMPVSALFLVTGDSTGAARSALTQGNINYYSVIKSILGLGSAQMKQHRVNFSHSDSYVLVNSVLQNGNVSIDPSCKGLIFDLNHVKVVYVEEKMKILKDRKDETRNADYMDTWRYLCQTFREDFVKFF